MKMSIISKIAYTLLVIGGLNWGFIGLFDYNVVGEVFSDNLARIIYGAVGVAGLYGVYSIADMRKKQGKA